MSEAQAATPEQQDRMNDAIRAAQEQAIQEVQRNAQIEIQMRVQALGAAVNATKDTATPEEISKAASVFLKFLKQGEA